MIGQNNDIKQWEREKNVIESVMKHDENRNSVKNQIVSNDLMQIYILMRQVMIIALDRGSLEVHMLALVTQNPCFS